MVSNDNGKMPRYSLGKSHAGFNHNQAVLRDYAFAAKGYRPAILLLNPHNNAFTQTRSPLLMHFVRWKLDKRYLDSLVSIRSV